MLPLIRRERWSPQQRMLTLVLLCAAIVMLMGRTGLGPSGWSVQAPIESWFSDRPATTEPPLPFVLCGAAVPGGLHDPLLAADGRPRPVATVVSSEPLSHAPGKRITVAVVKFAPGSYSPPHVHGGTVSVYILKGTIRSQIDSGPIGTFNPGDTFFEPLGAVHTLSENVSVTEPAELLAIFVHEEGATLTTYLE